MLKGVDAVAIHGKQAFIPSAHLLDLRHTVRSFPCFPFLVVC